MKRIPLYITTLLLTATFTGCSQDEDWGNENTNKEQVLLSAGITSEVTSAQTRATGGSEIAFTTSNTEMKLYASATWNGHGVKDTEYANTVIKVVKASVSTGESSTDTGHDHNHNKLTNATGSDWLYWDDFGAGDLTACSETGNFSTTPIATEGLTIYGIAVDGAAIPTRYKDLKYADLTKVMDEIPVKQDGGITTEDVVISNNVRKVGTETSGDNRHKYKKGESSTNTKELVFKHIYNKITLNFKAGDGFVDKDGKAVTLSAAKSVTLPGYNIKGLLDVTTGVFTFGKDKDDATITSTGTITDLYHLNTPNKIDDTKSYDQSYQALTLPGREFTNTGTDEALTFNFDGNTYSVPSSEIYAALKNGTDETGNYATMKSGVHYIFNITVNKTDVKLTAIIADWIKVEAADAPVLNIDAERKDTYTGTTAMPANFQLYYSASPAKDYTTSKMFGNTSAPVEVQAAKGADNTYNYSFIESGNDIKLYWPNHTTPYNFRGVVALKDADNTNIVETVTDGTSASSFSYAASAITRATEPNKTYYPTVVKDDTNGDYVGLASGIDDKNNVLIGTHANTVDGNNTSGALATTGKVRLTFYHMMAHVTVQLRTSGTTDAEKVNLGYKPETGNAVMPDVKVLSYKKDGKALLGACTSSATGEAAEYLMPTIAETYSATATDNFYSRASYMVPQDLTADMKFQVKIKNVDGTTDTYTSKPIKDIKVKIGTATTESDITSWIKGGKYIYTLTITKTGLNVTAVLVDWTKYEGSTEVPFM